MGRGGVFDQVRKEWLMTAPAGWYLDPQNDIRARYWTGHEWTTDIKIAGRKTPRLPFDAPIVQPGRDFEQQGQPLLPPPPDGAWGMEQRGHPSQMHPVDRARAAFARGDRLLHLAIPISWIQGHYGVGSTETRTREPDYGDVLGEIEALGWHLEHASSTFVEYGSSATKRPLANVGSTLVANHGAVLGVYVFRRAPA